MSELITVSVAARILEKSEGTIRTMANRGDIPSVRTSTGTRLFQRGVLERLAAKQKAPRGEK